MSSSGFTNNFGDSLLLLDVVLILRICTSVLPVEVGCQAEDQDTQDPSGHLNHWLVETEPRGPDLSGEAHGLHTGNLAGGKAAEQNNYGDRRQEVRIDYAYHDHEMSEKRILQTRFLNMILLPVVLDHKIGFNRNRYVTFSLS